MIFSFICFMITFNIINFPAIKVKQDAKKAAEARQKAPAAIPRREPDLSEQYYLFAAFAMSHRAVNAAGS